MKKGFTLIELLMVIAILGILASIILISLNEGRVRSKNANIEANLTQARSEAALYRASQNPITYNDACIAVSTHHVADQLAAACFQSTGNTSDSSCKCVDNTNAFAITVPYNPDSRTASKYAFCADSSGFAGSISSSEYSTVSSTDMTCK